MSSIDEVINRSREEGEFTERREFSIARGQAIEKLREFALVDPHYYILELIQSAIANGATYIDIQCGEEEMALSYIGGSFRENALAQLFDFLFASEDDLEHGPLRQLALGVNALMLFEPDEIVVESGNGTLAGTSRIAIRGEKDTVEVGRPDKPLEGTFVRARGMERDEMRDRSSLNTYDGHPREYRAVEDRCLVAPVPILFNQEPVFGYSSQRTPKSLYGFGRTVSFDEGDLYGTIGVARRHSGAVFRLLTHGVWIESTRYAFDGEGDEEITNLGGVVTFDRLRKTADHSSIVEDERYHEMWLRLRPYVNQLLAGETEASNYDVTTLSGGQLENKELLDLLRNSEGVVLVPPSAAADGPDHEEAYKIGESLGLPVLCAPPDTREIVRTLGGRSVDFVVPDLTDDKEFHFYTRNEASLPARPWLIAPVDLGTSSLLEVVDNLPKPGVVTSVRPRLSDESVLEETSVSALRKAAWLLGEQPSSDETLEEWKSDQLDNRGESIHATIYSPEDREANKRSINVEVRTAQRVVWEGEARAIAPGQVLVVDVSDIAPRRLWRSPEGEDKPVAQLIAEGVIRGHFSELDEAADRGLRAALRADVEPNTNAAQLILSSLGQRVVKRIRGDEGSSRIQFSVVDPELQAHVLEIPVLRTVDGDEISLRDVEQLMERSHGLLYAVRADIDADLEGLDTSRILLVDEALEEILISLVGPTAYCRVDERDVIVEYNGLKCRDIAVGLKDYPDFPLLVEGADPATVDDKGGCVEMLVTKLVNVVESNGEDFESQELRRQAWRHLQWFATHRADWDFARSAGNQVDELPLFALADGRTCSWAALRELLDQRGRVQMLDGWAVGAGEMSFDEAVDRRIDIEETDRDGAPDFELKMNPFVLHLLGDIARGVAEYHLSEQELDAVTDPELGIDAMLERIVVDNDDARGVIGVPNVEVDEPAVVVFSEESRQAVLREDVGETFGVIGKLRLRQGVDHDEVEDKVTEVARDVLSHLLARLPELASGGDQGAYERALEVLLEFAGGQVQLIGRRDSTIESRVHDALAREILNAPLFPTTEGMPTSAMALYHDFQDQAGSALARGEDFDYRPEVLTDEIPEVLEQWLDDHLRVERVHRPTTARLEDQTDPVGAHETEDPTFRGVAQTLEHWINVLHPDTDEYREGPGLHIDVAVDDELFAGDLADEFCQLRGGDDTNNRPLLVVNKNHWLTRWVLSEGDASSKPIAWAVLGAYAHVNNMLEPVTNEHELICQQRVASALTEDRLAMLPA